MSTQTVVPKGNWIQTFTGGKFHPLDPVVEEVNILDIAHALANQCRFTGHVKKFYSVAQHCVLVSQYCDPKDALWGLLHDAPEAYICDLARPVKYDPRMAFYKVAEKDIEMVIAVKFGLKLPEPEAIKMVDRRLLMTERRDLLPHLEWTTDDKKIWDVSCEPYPERIQPWSHRHAKSAFLNRFEELTKTYV